MTATEETKPKEPAARRLHWMLLGPLLGVVLLIAGFGGWEAWKEWRFEKERTETPPHVVEDLKLKLLWIPAGTFLMGTEDEAGWLKALKGKYNELKPSGWADWKVKEVHPSETPATLVTLMKGFYLGETEVTQAQWEVMMGSNPSKFKGPNRPVENVSWEDCVGFCKKLTERERAAGRIGAKQVFRLPTEAEWEYACRAGSRGEWCFGDDAGRLGEFAWYAGNSRNETHEVGKLRANVWGICDMHGNVWEWCADWHGSYLGGGKVADPTGAVSGSFRVGRGGRAWSVADYCRSAFRGRYEPGYRFSDLGFRVVLSAAP